VGRVWAKFIPLEVCVFRDHPDPNPSLKCPYYLFTRLQRAAKQVCMSSEHWVPGDQSLVLPCPLFCQKVIPYHLNVQPLLFRRHSGSSGQILTPPEGWALRREFDYTPRSLALPHLDLLLRGDRHGSPGCMLGCVGVRITCLRRVSLSLTHIISPVGEVRRDCVCRNSAWGSVPE
jgi:hypothetical protein